MALVSSLLFSSLSLHSVLGVITNQGPRWPVEDDEDVEVSDFDPSSPLVFNEISLLCTKSLFLTDIQFVYV